MDGVFQYGTPVPEDRTSESRSSVGSGVVKS